MNISCHINKISLKGQAQDQGQASRPRPQNLASRPLSLEDYITANRPTVLIDTADTTLVDSLDTINFFYNGVFFNVA